DSLETGVMQQLLERSVPVKVAPDGIGACVPDRGVLIEKLHVSLRGKCLECLRHRLSRDIEAGGVCQRESRSGQEKPSPAKEGLHQPSHSAPMSLFVPLGGEAP